MTSSLFVRRSGAPLVAMVLFPALVGACSSSSSGSVNHGDASVGMDAESPTDSSRSDGNALREAAVGSDTGACPEEDAGLQPPGCSSAGATVNDGVACCSTTSTDNGNGTFTCLCSAGPANQTGFSCNVNTDCCSGPCYNYACCKPPQEACSAGGDCCSGTCNGGKCACSPAGAFCTVNADCCGCAKCETGQCAG
jgi:hypothetical protein